MQSLGFICILNILQSTDIVTWSRIFTQKWKKYKESKKDDQTHGTCIDFISESFQKQNIFQK